MTDRHHIKVADEQKHKIDIVGEATTLCEDLKLLYDGVMFRAWQGDHYRKVDVRLDMTRWYLRHGGVLRKVGVLTDLEQQCRAIAFTDKKLPYWRDGRQGEYIAFRNGIMDLDAYRGGAVVIYPHSPDWVSTYCLPYDCDPSASCPLWMRFLEEVFDGDGESQSLLAEWFGYCLTQDTLRHALMILCGLPRGGKGVTCEILKKLVGDHNCIDWSLGRLLEKFSCSALVDKQVAIIDEAATPSGSKGKLIMERLTSIVGRGGQTIERKGKDIENSVILPTRFTIGCNAIPHMYDDSGAFAARMLVLHYKRSFADRVDLHLGAKLAQELPGIANWALQGLLRLDRQGWTRPESSQPLIRRTEDAANPTLAFLRACCVVSRSVATPQLTGVEVTDDKVETTSDRMEEAHHRWSEEAQNGEAFIWFTRHIRDMLPDMPDPFTQRKVLPNGKRVRTYKGIGLKAQ